MEMKRVGLFLVCLIFLIQGSYAAEYYVSLNGNDGSGDGSSDRPWRTLQHAVSKVPANQGHTIKIQAGTFVESAYINVPAGVNIEGAGIGITVLKPSSNLYHQSYAWIFDKFLISFQGGTGNQKISGLTIDGVSKQLYGGIVVNGRNSVVIENVRVQYTYFTGIWMWVTNDCRVTKVQLKDCAWGSSNGASGALQISQSERLEVDHMDIDEGTGQAVDAVGAGKMYYLKMHDNRFSVNPQGNWQTPGGVTVPNICVEFYNVDLKGCEVYNNYFDNNFSIAMDEPKFATPTGIQTIRVYNNTFDLITRAKGSGHCIELTLHDAEVDHNHLWGGSTAIANWDASANPHTMHNWKIHHNTFYGVSSYYPSAIINMYRHGVDKADIYNNTVELSGSSTVNFIEVNNGGIARNVKIENNLIIDSNTSYQWYPNKFISLVNNALMENATARNNFVQKMSIGSVGGVSYSGNLSGDPMINKTGNKPSPYYELKSGSPLINAGVNYGGTFAGSAPDIGAFEFGSGSTTPVNQLPAVSITSPSDNASFAAGATVNIVANASDNDGTISKVEFFQGSTKLGEDATSPYAFSWSNVAAGNYQITAKATDNSGSTTTSSPISISVNAPNAPSVSITAPSNNESFNAGATITVNATANDQDGTITKVEFYRGTVKLGEDTSSPYSFTWSNVPAGSYQLTATAIDNSGSSTTSAVINISVTATNIVPTINITSPANNATFNEGEAIPITATSTDADGNVTKVEFFQGTTKLGEDISSPYSFTWNNATAGTYQLTAKTTDNAGASVTSSVTTVVVNSASGTSPTINITSPANNATFNEGAGIPITVFATDPDGQIVKVEFFNGTTKLGEDTSSPHTFTWNNATAGTYQLTAKTTDNSGLTGFSAPVTVVVKASGIDPTVNITSPANNATFNEGAGIPITVFATDPDGQIVKVEFFNGTDKLGEDTSSPHNFTWNNAPAGTHQLIAKTTDNSGLTGSSDPITITVSASTAVPLVEITSPASNAQFNAGAAAKITATASVAEGTVSRVEFYNGSTKLGEDATNPYGFTWYNVPAGNHKISAKAIDENEGTATSAMVNIIVNSLPVIAISSPANGAIITEGSNVTLAATASDADGFITKVEFFSGNTKVGEDTSSPYTSEMQNVKSGVVHIVVQATDNSGAVVNMEITLNIVKPGEESQIKIPRVFSPNDDGINDVWEWGNMEQYENCTLSVFNRIGNKIYETTSYRNNWDGKVDGKPLPEDAYYYVITCDNNEILGAVRIVR